MLSISCDATRFGNVPKVMKYMLCRILYIKGVVNEPKRESLPSQAANRYGARQMFLTIFPVLNGSVWLYAYLYTSMHYSLHYNREYTKSTNDCPEFAQYPCKIYDFKRVVMRVYEVRGLKYIDMKWFSR